MYSHSLDAGLHNCHHRHYCRNSWCCNTKKKREAYTIPRNERRQRKRHIHLVQATISIEQHSFHQRNKVQYGNAYRVYTFHILYVNVRI